MGGGGGGGGGGEKLQWVSIAHLKPRVLWQSMSGGMLPQDF